MGKKKPVEVKNEKEKEIKQPHAPKQGIKLGLDLLQLRIEADKEKINKHKEWFKLNYKVDIRLVDKEEYLGRGGVIEPVKDFGRVAKELDELKMELVKLPPAFFAKLNIKEFVFGERMFKLGKDGEKLNDGSQLRASVSPGSGSVFFAMAYTIHHELFHVMDGLFAGGLDGGGGPIDANSWGLYSKSYKQDKQWVALEPELKKDNYDEDQANYCMILFRLDDPEWVKKYYEPEMQNPGKAKKYEQMKQWLFTWSDGKLNEKFWADLKDGKVKEGYWK
jgi:hypothetical protein